MPHYSRSHYKLVSPRVSTAAEADERIRYRNAAERAAIDRAEQFPVLTAENAGEAIAYQERRIKEILGGTK